MNLSYSCLSVFKSYFLMISLCTWLYTAAEKEQVVVSCLQSSIILLSLFNNLCYVSASPQDLWTLSVNSPSPGPYWPIYMYID